MTATPPYTAFVAFATPGPSGGGGQQLFNPAGGTSVAVAPTFMVVDSANSIVVSPSNNVVVNMFPGDNAVSVRRRFEAAVLNLGVIGSNPVDFVYLP